MIQKTLSIKKRADISVRPYDVAARLLKIMAYVSFAVVGACIARPRNNITFCRLVDHLLSGFHIAALTSSGTTANTLNTVISDISTLTALHSRFIYCTSCSK